MFFTHPQKAGFFRDTVQHLATTDLYKFLHNSAFKTELYSKI